MHDEVALLAIRQACIDFFMVHIIFELTTRSSNNPEAYKRYMHDFFLRTLSTPKFDIDHLKLAFDIWLETMLQDSMTNVLQWLCIIVSDVDMHPKSDLMKAWWQCMAQNSSRRRNRSIYWLDHH